MFYHSGNNPKRSWYQDSVGTAVTHLIMLLWENCGRSLELWSRKAIEISNLGELFVQRELGKLVLRERQMMEAWLGKLESHLKTLLGLMRILS